MIRHNHIAIDRSARTIVVHGRVVRFIPQQTVAFKAIEALLLAGPVGLTREQIYNAAHGDCPNGGTEGGPHDVHVWLVQAFTRTFENLGVVIHRLPRDPTVNRIRYVLRVV